MTIWEVRIIETLENNKKKIVFDDEIIANDAAQARIIVGSKVGPEIAENICNMEVLVRPFRLEA